MCKVKDKLCQHFCCIFSLFILSWSNYKAATLKTLNSHVNVWTDVTDDLVSSQTRSLRPMDRQPHSRLLSPPCCMLDLVFLQMGCLELVWDSFRRQVFITTPLLYVRTSGSGDEPWLLVWPRWWGGHQVLDTMLRTSPTNSPEAHWNHESLEENCFWCFIWGKFWK